MLSDLRLLGTSSELDAVITQETLIEISSEYEKQINVYKDKVSKFQDLFSILRGVKESELKIMAKGLQVVSDEMSNKDYEKLSKFIYELIDKRLIY